MLKNKNIWFYAFLAAIALLLVAVVVIVVVSVNSGDTPDDPTTIPEGSETGVYYYDVEQGEIILSLNSGNKFTIAGPGLNKSGTYTVTDGNVTFDFIRDEDGTATATLGDNTVVMTYKDAVMTFLKKVNYTVTFNTNGGNTIDAITVVNGKPVAKPTDPTKSGNVFIGWYTDAACKTKFDFTSAITADTTVYAAWAEKVIGQEEYTVSFDAGYAASADIASIETVGGKIVHDLPVPEREGYTFAGWYVSMYQDGEKLSYAYTADTVLDANTTLYAVWHENGSTKLTAPDVSVSAGNVKWNVVTDATAYKLKITNAAGEVVLEETLGATTKNVNFSDLSEGDYTVEVIAVANNSANNSEAAVRYYRNKALTRVSKFQVINGVLIFNAVEGAEKYIISVDCGNDEHNHTLLDLGTSTSYDFANCLMQPGGIVFTVYATANGYASSIPQTYVYDQSLAAVDGIVYNAANDTFVWNAVENATGYTVTVTVGDKTYTFRNGMSTSFSTAAFTGNITVGVVPTTDGYNSPAAATATCTKTAPTTPQNVTVNGMIVTWDAVENATKYEVKVGNVTFEATTNSIDLTEKNLGLTAGQKYEIVIKAFKDAEASAYSTPVVAEYQSMNPVLTYKNNTVYWSAILGCTNYEVRVNGGEAIKVSGVNFAKVVLTQAGKNVIEVKCTDIAGSEWTSVEVTAYTIVYKSRSLGGEITEYVAIGDTMLLPGNFTIEGYDFTGWYNSPSAANGNGKEYTQTVFTGNGDMTLYANWTPKDYNIKFIVDSTVTNVQNESTQKVTYTKDFYLAPAISSNEALGFFVGWYTGPQGTGIQITDSEGYSVAPYDTIGDTTVYPYFADALTFVLLPDGTYGVKSGNGIVNKKVTDIVIPATYKGVAVTQILDNAFYYCLNIVSVSLPDTITRIGIGAFDVCKSLESVNVYVVDPNSTAQKYYDSADGALIYFDEASGNTYLEFFPRAKKGVYTVPETVDNIRPYAFKYSTIEKVIISKGVTYVAENAFYQCTKLKEIEFEFERENFITIEKNAFTKLEAVHTLILPAKLNEIENLRMFDDLTALETIEVEEGGEFYSSVNNYLCDALATTILYVPKSYAGVFEAPMGITSIGDSIFEGNTKLTEVIIPAYVESIGERAFAGCTGITKVTVKARNNALTLATQAFAECELLTEVIFEGNTVATAAAAGGIVIGTEAFANCVELARVSVGAGVVIDSIGTKAFSGDISLSDLAIDTAATVTAIGDYAFEGCISIKAYTVHATTTSIGNYAFSGCSYLETFEFAPNGGEVSFGEGTFQDCVRLTTIKLPATLSSFDGSVFDGCEHITNIEIAAGNPYLEQYDGALYTTGLTELIYYPRSKDGDLTKLPWDKLTKIGPSVFKGNAKLINVVIGAKITEIGNSAFENCINLETLTFANVDGAMKIGDSAFAGCTQITGMTLPAGTTEIGHYAFYMTKLNAFNVPATVTKIGNFAFAYTNIASINIPATVTYVGQGAFYKASSLAEVIFAEGEGDLVLGGTDGIAEDAEEYNYGVFMGTKITAVTLPKNIKSIGNYAFAQISGLTTVNLSADARLTEIGAYAFANSGLQAITLNEGLETINTYAFAYTALNKVHIPASVKFIYEYAFSTGALVEVTFAAGTADNQLDIQPKAFVGASFAEINLPAHLVNLGAYVTDYSYQDVYGVFYQDTGLKGGLKNNKQLAKITVAEGCAKYTTIDSVLYEKDATGTIITALFCPKMNTGDITIPKTATLVQSSAFVDNHLNSIVFEEYAKEDENYGKQLLSIGAYEGTSYACPSVFGRKDNSYYTTLTSIKFPSHLKSIGTNAFYGATLKDYKTRTLIVDFNPDATISLAPHSMRNFYAALEIHLPKVEKMGKSALYTTYAQVITFAPGSTLVEIGEQAFSSNTYLTSITIPASVKSLGKAAFKSCGKLESITFEEGSALETIGDEAFYYTGFTTFKIPDTVTTVGKHVFRGCPNLTSIEISMSMQDPRTSESSIVHQASKVTEIIVPEGHPYLKSVDGVLYDKDMKILYAYPAGKTCETFVVPDTVTTIENGAFNYFPGKSIVIPEGVQYIMGFAFTYAKMDTIHLPASLKSIGDHAFYYATNLHTVTFAENAKLETVESYAFGYVYKLENIVLPDTVTTLGAYAFTGDREIKEFTVPAGVKDLGTYTFSTCYGLEKLVLQEGLQTIASRAFQSTGKLKSITIPDTVTTMGDYVFYNGGYGENSAQLEEVLMSENSMLNKVGERLFYQCYELKKVTFGALVDTMGKEIFGKCTKLEEVRLSDAMTEVQANMFNGCEFLTTVNIPANATKIGDNAFNGCKSLTEITISKNVETIGINAFAGCAGLESAIFESGSTLTIIPEGAFDGTVALTEIALPSTITSIGDRAFKNSAIETAPITASTTKIGNEAFYGCYNITSISIPATVSVIGDYAFAGCINAESIALTTGLKNVGDFAFADCAKVTTVNIPETVAFMGANPFANCTGITSLTIDSANESFVIDEETGVLYDITGYTLIYYPTYNTEATFELPESVYEIAGGAFAGSQLQYIVISDNIKVVSDSAFKGSKLLTTVTIPESVTKIEKNAFADCVLLNNVTIPASVVEIGDYAFAGCATLDTFTLADRKVDITVGTHLFENCASLATIIEFPGNTKFTDYMYAGTGFVDLVIPDSITSLGAEGVFMNCTKLETVDFPAAPGYMIGSLFFAGCTALETIEIPQAIYSMGTWQVGGTFKDCTALRTVVMNGMNSIETSSFENCTALESVSRQGVGLVQLGTRAFANCTKLSGIDFFSAIYQYGEECFLNCSSLAVEIQLRGDGTINDYAFKGSAVSKLTYTGEYIWMNNNSLSGMKPGAVFYFTKYESYEELAAYMGWKEPPVWMTNTEAVFEYYTPAPGAIDYSLTTEEQTMLDKFGPEFGIRDGSKIVEAWVAYKKAFGDTNPSEKLTAEEIAALEAFTKEMGFVFDGERATMEMLQELWISYRYELARDLVNNPHYPTDEEFMMLEKFASTNGLTKEQWHEIQTAYISYKKTYEEYNPAAEPTEEDVKTMQAFIDKYKITTHDAKTLALEWVALKQTLAEMLPAAKVYWLTETEYKDFEATAEKYALTLDQIQAIKDLWNDWKVSFNEAKVPAELDKTEIEEIYTIFKDLGVSTEFIDNVVIRNAAAYRTELARRVAMAELTESDQNLILDLVMNAALDRSESDSMMEELFNYKKLFDITVKPEEKLTDAEIALFEGFMERHGVNSELWEKLMSTFVQYRIELYKTLTA